MENLYVVLLKFIPVLSLILLGVLIRRIKLLKPETVQELKTILINITLPSMFILTFANTKFELRYLYIFAAVFLVCLFMFLMGKGFSEKLCPGNSYYPSVFTGHENGMLGYALFTAFFGAENTFKLAIFDIGQVVFVFFVLVNFLRRQNGTSSSPKQVLTGFFKSPIILSITAGILLSSTGLMDLAQNFKITVPIVNVLTLLGNMTVPLICITLGYELKINTKNIVKPFLTVLLRMALMLAFAFIINEVLVERVLGLDKNFALALFTMFMLPPPFVIPVFMDEKAEKEKSDIMNVISINIVLTLVAFLILISVTS
jgi:malate permease and related proteins